MRSSYRLFMINFGWYLAGDFQNLHDAKKAATSKGYELRVDYYNAEAKESTEICSYSPINGWSYTLEGIAC